MTGIYSESMLVEQPAMELLSELGSDTANCFHEFDVPDGSFLGRENKGEVVLKTRLRPALERLNPDLPAEGIEQAIEELTRDRSAMSLVAANRELYGLIKDGVKVKIFGAEGEGETVETVRVIDWRQPDNNDFFLASQFWVTGEMYTRRADLVGFVNGLPLVFIELKTVHKRLKDAYDKNLADYRDTIPHVFWYNAFTILSNGSASVLGTVTASWEHFNEWKKINSEGEEGIVSLETILRGTCEPARLLDLVENFILFMETRGGIIKLVAKNHQYLGVNNALEALKQIENNYGRLGVFWHTQGSGKSISMIFFSQKALRTMPGNWTFVVVTDRKELDEQIYKNFANTGVITEPEAHATSAAHLRRLLREDHRYVFTLIHKFRTEQGERHPTLSERSDVIVIADEAHRSQYDTLALNMRNALPQAAFIAFTGTPLIVGEEKTRQVFGDYVSVYNFKQSTDDRATVPLYYENRIPELQLTNEDLNDDIYHAIEEAGLDEEQEEKLEREFSRQYHLITRDDRLETIAQDIVTHFMGRGFRGKAMVVGIDKATAVKMYDKVQKYWNLYLSGLHAKLSQARAEERKDIEDEIRYMEETDMAVVVSPSQNEAVEMRKKGADIVPHRRRMVKEDLDTKFKDPDDRFRIVFVCAMWMTGFDVPCCSTIYLDKPMRNHTLMQTIARANRVFRDKVNGLIVDYVGVFRSLQKALAIYGSGSGGGIKPGETPVKDKSALVDQLEKAIAQATGFCEEHGVHLDAVKAATGFEKVKAIDDAVEAFLANDETRKRYVSLAAEVKKLFKAILPDPRANQLAPDCIVLDVIAQKIRSLSPPVDISGVMTDIEAILDQSIAAQGYVIKDRSDGYGSDRYVDLSKLDFEALAARFKKARKRIEAEKLKNAVGRKLAAMVRLNRLRVDYLERFQRMIDEYNSGSANVETFFDELLKLAKELTQEEQRHIAEKLSEEELALFDILTKPDIKLKKTDRKRVKKVARELLATLKEERLPLDWRKRQQTRAVVRLAIEQILERLPGVYTTEIFNTKCELVYQHVYESYFGAGRSIYAAA